MSNPWTLAGQEEPLEWEQEAPDHDLLVEQAWSCPRMSPDCLHFYGESRSEWHPPSNSQALSSSRLLPYVLLSLVECQDRFAERVVKKSSKPAFLKHNIPLNTLTESGVLCTIKDDG